LAIGDKVIPIHHHRHDENYSFNPRCLDDVVQSFVAPLEGEDVAIKHGDSGFVDTSLEQILGDAGFGRLVVCGATANYGADQMKYFTPSSLHDEFAKVLPTSEPLVI
jgi:nicotinamidase-related amidase